MGFILAVKPNKDKPGVSSWCWPLMFDAETGLGISNDVLEPDVKIVASVPVTSGTVRVIVRADDGRSFPIGYETPGAAVPDWDGVAQALVEMLKSEKKPLVQ